MSELFNKDILIHLIEESDLYSKRFGRFTKTDYEVLMFTIFMDSQKQTLTNYDIGSILGLTESKVGNLRIKSQLYYPKKHNYVEEVKNALNNGRYNPETRDITIVFKDPVVQNEIRNRLEKRYQYVGLNHNPKQLILSIEDYIKLALSFETEEDKLIKELNNHFKKNSEITGLIEKDSITKNLFTNVNDIVSLLANIVSLFTGGKPIVDGVISLIKNFSASKK